MDWSATKNKIKGIRYESFDGRVVVTKIEFTRAGAFRKNLRQMGWAVFVDGVQHGAAHKTARAAREFAEQPGVAAGIKHKLGES